MSERSDCDIRDIIARDREETAREAEIRRQKEEQSRPQPRVLQAVQRLRSYPGPRDAATSASADWVAMLGELHTALAAAVPLLHQHDADHPARRSPGTSCSD